MYVCVGGALAIECIISPMLGSILPLSNIPALTLLFQTFDGSMASDWHIHHLVALSPLLGQTPAQGCLSYSLT